MDADSLPHAHPSASSPPFPSHAYAAEIPTPDLLQSPSLPQGAAAALHPPQQSMEAAASETAMPGLSKPPTSGRSHRNDYRGFFVQRAASDYERDQINTKKREHFIKMYNNANWPARRGYEKLYGQARLQSDAAQQAPFPAAQLLAAPFPAAQLPAAFPAVQFPGAQAAFQAQQIHAVQFQLSQQAQLQQAHTQIVTQLQFAQIIDWARRYPHNLAPHELAEYQLKFQLLNPEQRALLQLFTQQA